MLVVEAFPVLLPGAVDAVDAVECVEIGDVLRPAEVLLLQSVTPQLQLAPSSSSIRARADGHSQHVSKKLPASCVRKQGSK